MAGMISFNRNYAAFGSQVRPFEKSDDVGFTVTEFMWFEGAPFYPIGSLIDAKISSAWLGEGEPQSGDEADLDLIFKMREQEGFNFFEIVLRTAFGAVYGGYAGGQSLEVTDEIVNGHRVLIAHTDSIKDRYEYSLETGQYMLTEIFSQAGRGAMQTRLLKKARGRR